MDTLSTHIEFLLRTHDCVVLPGLGSFICKNISAEFSPDKSCVLPPGRSLVFNPLLNHTDGMLASSIARKDKIPYKAATQLLAAKIEHLRASLQRDREFRFGHIGVFSLNEENVPMFEADEIAGINGSYFGLQPVALQPIESVEENNENATFDQGTKRRRRSIVQKIRPYSSGIAAAIVLALILCIYLAPIDINRPTTEASLYPIEVEEDTEKTPEDVAPDNSDKILTEEIQSTPVEETIAPEIIAPAASDKAAPQTRSTPSIGKAHFDSDDAFCVIIASFDSLEKAESYIAQHASEELGVLTKDGRFRVYAATGNTYANAEAQKKMLSYADAWVCRR